jgi:hypothetical protein
VVIRHLWQLKTVVFLHRSQIRSVLFHNFAPPLLHYLKLSSSKFWKFCTHNAKAMMKDKKVNITVTYAAEVYLQANFCFDEQKSIFER